MPVRIPVKVTKEAIIDTLKCGYNPKIDLFCP
jgi:hypothetical protein